MTRSRCLAGWAAVALLVTAGCGGSSRTPAAGPATSTSSAASPSASSASSAPADPAARLAELAGKAAAASYAGSYALRGAAVAGGPSLVRVAVTPTAARIGLTGNGRTALFVRNPHGQFACDRRRETTDCYRLAGRGQRVPPYLDPGVQHVFLDYPQTLAHHVSDYTVTAAPSTPAAAGLPAGSCFRVRGTSPAAVRAVATGVYCFADTGVLTGAAFPSGRITLTGLGAAPPAATLTPPVSATPLPAP